MAKLELPLTHNAVKPDFLNKRTNITVHFIYNAKTILKMILKNKTKKQT